MFTSRQGLCFVTRRPWRRNRRQARPQPQGCSFRYRVRMAELAAATSEAVMVDGWEAAQLGWQRTLAVMRRVSVVWSTSPVSAYC